MSQRLYVIGNGLDLHHGIRSGYNDFRRFVQAAEPRVFALINDYLAVDHDFWSCFEERLATFDPDSVTDHAERFLASYGADDWSDSSHHDYEYEIERIVDGISVDLRRLFGTWVRALPMPPPGSFSPVKCIRAEGWFLTFNYTPTLQRLYGISERNVLHIHGRSSDPDAEIVLGHGWDRSTADMLSPLADEDTDTRVAGGYALIDGYFAATFKPTAEIMQRHHDLFDALGAVTEVVVLGHSLADVDAPYLEAIVSRVSRDCQWTISRHVEPSLEQSRFQQLGCPMQIVSFGKIVTVQTKTCHPRSTKHLLRHWETREIKPATMIFVMVGERAPTNERRAEVLAAAPQLHWSPRRRLVRQLAEGMESRASRESHRNLQQDVFGLHQAGAIIRSRQANSSWRRCSRGRLG